MEFVSYDIENYDYRRAGAASRSIKEHLKRIGADADAIRRTMIAAYEAEMNVVIHSVGGRLEASFSDAQIDVNVVDNGPGIPDIELAMTEGFSTAGAEARTLGFGAGLGLPNIRRNSDRVRVTSRLGEGTRVSFTVYLKPGTTGAPRVISLYAYADRCRDCRRCLVACPTQAIRVRNGAPVVLEHLCVDCTDCIGACTPQALTVRSEVSSLSDLNQRADTVLAVPPALLAGCGANYPPARVLAGLRTLGFADVITVAPFEEALREAAWRETTRREDARREDPPARDDSSPHRGPLIVPSCPAVVNLIELRFPSLVPQLAPFESAWEALQATYADRSVAYVVSCPSQRSALLAHDQAEVPGSGASTRAEYLTPDLLRQAVMMRMNEQAAAPAPRAGRPGAGPEAVAAETDRDAAAVTASEAGVLSVTGMSHVIAVLERVENGLLDDVGLIEPYACAGGCFGSPLLFEDHHVALRRWNNARAGLDTHDAALAGGAVPRGAARPAAATARRRPYAARPGIRLDPDMARAIEKLGHLQAVKRSLPGRDCGACGAPTCAALAEDIVMQRAGVDLCPYACSEKEEPDR
jgi:anti-sigma regulatory factor (Ser/Thr protein kinase)/Na+-translocating ferredoxin:NAD+ oxidoreductase RNF subunit RnfB